MKKVVLFALLIAAAAATSAFAHQEPQMWKIYSCSYDNYSGPALNPGGLSYWEKRPGSWTEMIYTFEHFKRSNGTWDAYKATWAKPVTDAYGFTTWEFTFNPYGPQCKKTVISPGGYTISFSQCTDGHTRYCWTQ